MTAVTVKRFAEQIGVSEERLLQQLKNAGVLDKTIDGDLLISLAVIVGGVRLIDNIFYLF